MTKFNNSQNPIEPEPTVHLHYKSPIFATKTTAEKIATFARQSPYFMIALAINSTLLALATVCKLHDSSEKLDHSVLNTTVSHVSDEKKTDEQPLQKELFTDDDEPIDSIADDQSDNVPDLVFNTAEWKFSDHEENDTNSDGDSVRGNDMNSKFVSSDPGLGRFDTIGIGSGSERGGRRGYGHPGGGGNENLKRRRNRTNTPKTAAAAVEAGLEWLARHQDPGGYWSPDAFDKNCQGGTACGHSKQFGYPEFEVGNTGLAVLAFLGAGYDSHSPMTFTDHFTKKKIRVGDVVKNALLYLKENQDETGSFVSSTNHKWGYNHSIATLAMSEAYGLSKGPLWKSSAQNAINSLIAGQNPAPGGTGLWAWRYRPNSGDNDISVTGWAVMALKSAELAGLKYSQESMEGAYQFCVEVTDKTTGHAGYLRREDAGKQVKAIGKNEDYANHPALAAVGMCVRTFVKHKIDDPVLEASAKLLIRDLPKWNKEKKTNDYYYWYYATLAMNQYDGPESPRAGKGALWREWESALKSALIDHQVSDPQLCARGSWDGDDRWGVDGGGRVYATAINTLNFEVYYRYGNAFGAAKKAK
ncbi:MAG: prenyltransferase/squalene oxidase repeat-containing protein [Planctomycetota bacterium]